MTGSTGPAAASHDDYGPGEVILRDEPGSRDRVSVVFPEDTPHEDAEARVRDVAEANGLEVADLDVVDNSGPDTVRVQVTTPVGTATSLLGATVPASVAQQWAGLSESGEVHLSLPRWSTVDGDPKRHDGDVVMGGEAISYRQAWWIPVLPALLLVVLPVVIHLLLRRYARRQVASEEERDVRVHRLRVATSATLLGGMLLLVAGSLLGGQDGVTLLLAAVAPEAPGWLAIAVRFSLLLLALVLVVLAVLLAAVPADRELRRTEQSTGGAVREALRAFLVIGVLGGVVGGIGGAVMVWDTWAYLAFLVVVMVVVAVLGPMLISRMMRTRELPEPHRSRLREQLEAHDVRVRDLRMIDTRGGKVVNAAISGVLPQLRYVFVTDHALEVLSEEDLEAVLAHEAGHGKGHHLLIKAGAALLPLLLIVGGGWAAREQLGRLLETVPLWGVLAAVWLVVPVLLITVQGVVGIALEKRADDYAARTVGAERLASALDALAEANVAKRRTGWLWNLLQQHPGLEGRIARLRSAPRSEAPADG
ncbi:M48 family metalloprotease [Serinicoccus marinus]|uniref:M48 family metalloprotease n=1 Tax=Serinicoccus marinus TaxID=247333 RepID=UPI00248F802E|nr:M48 family metalloprotease [Serinicoccus marinus]